MGVTDFDRALEQVNVEEREDLIESDQGSDDDDYYNEDYQDQAPGIQQETDPQILKLQDKVRLLRHRCVASIGNNIFEQAMDYLLNSGAAASQEQKRQKLC